MTRRYRLLQSCRLENAAKRCNRGRSELQQHRSFLLQWCDPIRFFTITHQPPISLELFSVNTPPLEHQRSGAWRKFAVHPTIGDADLNLISGVPGVEVRWLMVIMIHGDNDSEEPADLRHAANSKPYFRGAGDTHPHRLVRTANYCGAETYAYHGRRNGTTILRTSRGRGVWTAAWFGTE